ncbi:MAG TPA: alpha/beta fold hydrolase [Pirellulales bacterium]|nr:alpha/beta fold hydrolase [Pirellulales bacterium]
MERNLAHRGTTKTAIASDAEHGTGAVRLRRPSLRLALVLLLAGLSTGCTTTHYVKVNSAPHSPLVERLKLTSWGGPQPSARTLQLLRQYDLLSDLHGNMRPLLDKLQTIVDREPTPDKVYGFAELNYIAGRKSELASPDLALDYFGTSVMHAYQYLFDPRYGPMRNPYDPEFRGACDVYNGALESALRLVQRRGGLLPGRTYSIESASQAWDVKIVVSEGRWQNDDFAAFKFVSDYEVQGLQNQFHNFGLGVPLIAIRERHAPQQPGEQFLPAVLSFPVTAFLHVVPDARASPTGTRPRHIAVLELHDPLSSPDIIVAGRRVPLETDLSTPLAYFLNDPQLDPNNPRLNLETIATQGLLHPDKTAAEAGLYMLQPYEPDKIPVLMIHGLWSSPMTWMEMFNDLRGDPEIRKHYQFWFYLYPTGQPFWNSATRLRADLAQARAVLDPQRREPAFDQMVLVGHSMGGLVAKMQTVASRDRFWHIVSDKPFQVVKASSDERRHLEETFFFRPDPSVRRLITIATPNRGSEFANGTTRWLAKELINLPQLPSLRRDELIKENPDVFRTRGMLQVKTSIDSLAPDSPILPVLLQAEQPPWVKCHNIVGVLPDTGLIGSVAGGSDGVVSYESAHLDNVASELKVAADHWEVNRHPLSILEVRRILLEHLHDVRSFPYRPAASERTAAAAIGGRR